MRKLLKNFICKVFNIKQCACPSEEATTKTTVDVPESNAVGTATNMILTGIVAWIVILL